MVTTRHPAVIEGDVRHVRLPSLLQLAEAEMHTGRLALTPGGSVAVRQGAVVDAATDSGLTGLAAMRELFLVADGRFALFLDASIAGTPLAPTIALVMDGCKLMDEWVLLASERYVEPPRAPSPTPAEAVALARLQPVLAAMRDGATLEAAVAATGAHRSEIVPVLQALVDAGRLEPAAPEAPAAATPPPAATAPVATPAPPAPPAAAAPDEPVPDDLDELLSRARALMRRLELDAAERLLRAALERRPNDRVLAQNLRHLVLRRERAA
ncbi:MAG: DUF4388 domain-containing protein [Myxococcota bacterium]